MTKSETARHAVLEAIRQRGEASESGISRDSGVRGMWLSHALVGLLHAGVVEYAGACWQPDGSPLFVWRWTGRGALPARPSPSKNNVGRDGHD